MASVCCSAAATVGVTLPRKPMSTVSSGADLSVGWKVQSVAAVLLRTVGISTARPSADWIWAGVTNVQTELVP